MDRASDTAGPTDWPTDWLATPLQKVANFESALRCQICKEFFTDPVITSCCHTFCSLCIRRCLSAEGKCPVCRSGDQELKLRQNWAVRDLVVSFKAARPSILDFARRNDAHQVSESISDDTVGGPATKRRKVSSTTDSATDTGRTTRSRTRLSEPDAGVKDEPLVIQDSDDDEDFEPDDGLVACPVCKRRMKIESVFIHLDTCTGPPKDNISKASGTLGAPGSRNHFPPRKSPTRLPAINFALFKENSLKKKLRELGIPDWGQKPVLQRRYTEWMNLWNANCDAIDPKSQHDLLRDLKKWERDQGGLATPQASSRSGPLVMKKDFDVSAWSESHDEDYKKLIAKARTAKASRSIAPRNTAEDSKDGYGEEEQGEEEAGTASPAPNASEIEIRERPQELIASCEQGPADQSIAADPSVEAP